MDLSEPCRRAIRVPVDLPVWVDGQGASGVASARLVDLSATGAGLVCAGEPRHLEAGRSIRFWVGSTRVEDEVWSGRIVHQAALETGSGSIRFGVALAPAPTLEREVDRSRAATVPHSDVTTWLLGEVVADQALKTWAWVAATGARIELVPGLLAIEPIANPGALAGLGTSSPLTVPLCALTAVATAVVVSNPSEPTWRNGPWASAARGLLAAGLLGNALDRLALGYVRDVLASPFLGPWTFNLADVALVFGGLMVVGSHGRQAPEREALDPTRRLSAPSGPPSK